MFDIKNFDITSQQIVKKGKKVYYLCSSSSGGSSSVYIIEGTVQSIIGNCVKLVNIKKISRQCDGSFFEQDVFSDEECTIECLEKSLQQQKNEQDELFQMIINQLK